jgi:hypothetical protein
MTDRPKRDEPAPEGAGSSQVVASSGRTQPTFWAAATVASAVEAAALRTVFTVRLT